MRVVNGLIEKIRKLRALFISQNVHEAAAERPYPPAAEVAALWGAGLATSDDAEAAAYLRGRSIEPAHVDEHDLARVIARDTRLPSWARFQGRTWTATGHRLLVPTFDAAGAMRGVRAWRILPGDTPKRLPPTGYATKGLVLADGVGVAMLRGSRVPRRALVVEGEPDFLSVTTAASDADEDAPAVLGIPGMGAWTDELAARIPNGARVTVATHADDAGDGYAEAVRRALAKRCDVRRRRRPEAGPLRLVIAEGEPDFLTWASRLSADAEFAPVAVLGIVAGAWTPAIAARIPDGARVVVRTHHDEAGRKYAAQIHATLTGRCRLARSKG